MTTTTTTTTTKTTTTARSTSNITLTDDKSRATTTATHSTSSSSSSLPPAPSWSSPSSTILVPGPLDIVMGRGRHPKSCTGALRLHNFLLDYRDTYEHTPRSGKAKVVGKILYELKQSGCRFLTFESDGFVVCDDTSSREKISHAFRNLKARSKKKKEKNANNNNNNAASTAIGEPTNTIATTTTTTKKRNLIET